MHGIILSGLKDFVESTHGREAWRAIRDRADVEGRLYVPVATYPDEHVTELIGAALELTGEDPAALQFAFGEHLVPILARTYGVYVDGEWGGMELLANTEKHIHEALRDSQISEFDPPEIEGHRLDESTVVVRYGSDRGLCAVARGIVSGIGDYYDESYEIEEPKCMHDGADRCEIVVQRTPVAAETAHGAVADD